ncbi:3-hydroxybutyryl-CoA dehydrogenase [Rhizobium leguminosarum bv. viciae]|uniref:3-hydroxyacyl-CoA dehydrogenase NAD-binding domain-containing protein n=1 Tax=Rhizobium leguminosarum TaxID=384 RepID=UPI0019818D21|nr:3-hydroxyacyl-CoA dehydrogenase NAD-binding domain-containing protein [Rhizobium leguminosarum]NKK39387.1 3-hydroxybutyryl-CoA dehydrogenase [Rhizobium leguminosarum bv. viciae]
MPVVNKISTVAVIGAGQMGTGIVEVVTRHGYEALIYDLDKSRIRASIEASAGYFGRQAETGKMPAEAAEQAISRIKGAFSLSDLATADLVVEAVSENEDIKRKVFTDVCTVLKPPNRFIGIHFMNPVPVMKLVELVRGIGTDQETFAIAKDFAESIGKTVTVSEDFPAFIVNRILIPMINEAIYTLYEGVGNVEAIDTGMKLGANHPMGPLELADFIGLDTCLSIMQVLHEGLADSKYRPCPLLVKYVEAGWLGRKTQRGFYDYGYVPARPTR